MSAILSIEVYDKGATEMVRTLERELSPAQLQATYGPRCQVLTRDHLADLPDNKHGWPSTGFWEQAARATVWVNHGNFIKIRVEKIGVRQRYYGGHIAPVTKDALTIPISPISYGKTVADFPGAFLLKTPKGAYIVLKNETGAAPKSTTKSRRKSKALNPKRATFTFLFKLVGSVDQAPNPDVLPTPAEYRAVCFQAARERIAALKLRNS